MESDVENINLLFLETLFVEGCTEIIAINKKVGISMNDEISRRAFGLFFYLADKDFNSALKVIQIFEKCEVLHGSVKSEFFMDKWTKFDALFRDKVFAEKRAALLAWMLDVYNLDVSDIEISALVKKTFPSIGEQRECYAALRVVTERPQFLFSKKAGRYDLKLKNTVSDILEDAIYKLGFVQDRKTKSNNEYNNILFIFGHAQPLSYIGSHWRQVVTYVTGFCNAFPEKTIKLIVTNESTTRGFSYNMHALPKDWKERLLKQAEDIYGNKMPHNLKFSMYNPHDLSGSLEKISQEIIKFSPQMAFGWLGFFSASLFFRFISHFCNVYSIQFQAGNEPNRYSKNIFSQGDINNQLENIKKSGFNYINSPVPLVPEPNKEEWAVAPVNVGYFNVVTTLGNGRAEKIFKRYSNDFLRKFCSLFRQNEELRWVLVGVVKENFISITDDLDNLVTEGRIVLYERVDGLRSFYSHFSAYVHLPNFHGGGWGIGLAAFENIPVISQAGGDADNFLPEQSLFKTEVEFFDKFEVLVRDSLYRQQLVELQRNELEKHSPRNVAKNLYNYALEYENKT